MVARCLILTIGKPRWKREKLLSAISTAIQSLTVDRSTATSAVRLNLQTPVPVMCSESTTEEAHKVSAPLLLSHWNPRGTRGVGELVGKTLSRPAIGRGSCRHAPVAGLVAADGPVTKPQPHLDVLHKRIGRRSRRGRADSDECNNRSKHAT
ncbi:hypothetical protein EJ06DRAFT_524011 [Trichodelitschia bisporula]|uniref:Uncharacterized protein n=1 Tax=Trichodelitschia bisporula TaxID=703511 RepID=A0A6G1HP96_9PEZI|nr:hypothetical protein EJ06DRAFT_524011 [Trichodelitschia bisporula]